mgnify:CR=1 FL=1
MAVNEKIRVRLKSYDHTIIDAAAEKIVEVEGNFNFVRVLTLDLSGEFENQPTQEELKSRTQKYIRDNNIGVPKVSLRVSFVPLEQTEEYKNIALLERVNLCDTVNVEFEKLGVSATAKLQVKVCIS